MDRWLLSIHRLMRASFTVSWKMSLAKLLYFLVKKNLIAKGEKRGGGGAESKREKE
jgi:hypothetical protein